MIPAECGATVAVEDWTVQYVETWGYWTKSRLAPLVTHVDGLCYVLCFMQRGGDLPLLANRVLVGHRCRRGARPVSLALINRDRWAGSRAGSLQDYLARRVCRYSGLSSHLYETQLVRL